MVELGRVVAVELIVEVEGVDGGLVEVLAQVAAVQPDAVGCGSLEARISSCHGAARSLDKTRKS